MFILTIFVFVLICVYFVACVDFVHWPLAAIFRTSSSGGVAWWVVGEVGGSISEYYVRSFRVDGEGVAVVFIDIC